MKIEYKYSDSVVKQIEYYHSKMKEIMKSHFDNIDGALAFSIRQMTEAIRNMDNDLSIKLLEKEIENLYLKSTPQMIVIAESEEDKKLMKEFIERNRGHVNDTV